VTLCKEELNSLSAVIFLLMRSPVLTHSLLSYIKNMQSMD